MVKMHGIQILLSNSSIKQIEFLSNKGELNQIRNRARPERGTFTRERAGPASSELSSFVAGAVGGGWQGRSAEDQNVRCRNTVFGSQ